MIWVTAFDPKGNLLRTESGFFVSADGRFVSTAHANRRRGQRRRENGGRRYLQREWSSRSFEAVGFAVLKADVKPQKLLRFLELNKNADLSLAQMSQWSAARWLAAKVTAANEDHRAILGRFGNCGSNSCQFCWRTLRKREWRRSWRRHICWRKTIARPVTALESVLSHITAETHGRWPEVAEASPAPQCTPRPRLIYAPAPSFPPGASLPGQSGTGRFRLTFDAAGNVTNIQIVKSTGNPYFDQAAVKTLRQWKSAPSQGWEATVPVTFSNKMTKPQTAVLGFRVKSGWAAVVLLTRPTHALRLSNVSRVSCPIRDFPKPDSRITQQWENWKPTQKN